MITLSAAALAEKNKLAAGGVWLTLLEMQFAAATIRVVLNNEDIVWPTGVDTWTAFPFKLSEKSIFSNMQIPSITLSVSNASRLMQSYAEAEDGGIGVTCILRIVHSGHLDLISAELEETFEIVSTDADAEWLNVTLGLPNPLTKMFPNQKYLKNFCRWVFKGTYCAYAGGETTCNHTLTDCEARSNSAHFGAFPGIGFGGIYK